MADFAVTVPSAELIVDAARKGSTTVTITNTAGRPMRARLDVMPAPPAQPGWFTVVGDALLDFPLGSTLQRQVQVLVPGDAPPGPASVRYDVIPEDRPDNAVPGPSQSFTVPASTRKFPWWIVGVAAGVIVLGILIIALLGGGGDDEDAAPVTTVTAAPTTTQAPQKNVVKVTGQVNIVNVGAGTAFDQTRTGDFPINQTATLQQGTQSAAILTFQQCVQSSHGATGAVVVRVSVQVNVPQLGQTAKMTGSIQLFEQQGCTPTDLGRQAAINVDVEPGIPTTRDFDLVNNDGPDTASVDLLFTNTVS
jgi:hypothetical protein